MIVDALLAQKPCGLAFLFMATTLSQRSLSPHGKGGASDNQMFSMWQVGRGFLRMPR